MTTTGDVVFLVGILAGPPLALNMCFWLRVTRQPRWVLATSLALSAVLALVWVTYWYLWGKAFDYADAYRPVPPALDQASKIAIAACFALSVVVAALGVARLVVSWQNRHKSGLVPST